MAENKRHKGHRQRMRERVQSYGLDSLAEHEALEYVLYLTNAQKDTNGIAHDLIDRFGDFAAVLRQGRFRPLADAAALVAQLEAECALKEGAKGVMGFV